MSYKNNKKNQIHALHNQVFSLMKELRLCAPHPDQKDTLRPYSIAHHSSFIPNDANGGMLGSALMETILSAAFQDVASNDNSTGFTTAASYLDHDKLLDIASEYLSEQDTAKEHGRGSFAIGAKKAVSQNFNNNSEAKAMQAFLRDLPKREAIERQLAALASELDHLYVKQTAPTLAAA